MKYLCIIFFSFILVNKNRIGPFVDPTGTYILKGKFAKSELHGHYGEIRVKLLDSSKIAMTFYMNSGYPKYIAASFVDTMVYDGTRAAFSCNSSTYYKIAFHFTSEEVEISQLYSDPHASCGFGNDAIVSGTIKKYSNAIPVIKSLRTGT